MPGTGPGLRRQTDFFLGSDISASTQKMSQLFCWWAEKGKAFQEAGKDVHGLRTDGVGHWYRRPSFTTICWTKAGLLCTHAGLTNSRVSTYTCGRDDMGLAGVPHVEARGKACSRILPAYCAPDSARHPVAAENPHDPNREPPGAVPVLQV